MKIYDFRIEYREQPKGLAVKIPRFSWKIASAENCNRGMDRQEGEDKNENL